MNHPIALSTVMVEKLAGKSGLTYKNILLFCNSMIRSEKFLKLSQQLAPYLPDGYADTVTELLLKYPVKFVISKPRSTKLGDYRPPYGNIRHHQISVNGNSNKYQFLVTTLHEFAHLETYINYGRNVKPHGEEWKKAFRDLLWPSIQKGLLPKDLEIALMKSVTNLKAATCSDIHLSRILRNYDEIPADEVVLESLGKNSTFVLQGRTFVKGDKRRTRYLCTEVGSSRQFVINSLALVKAV